jgi:hypothetical protein
MKKYHTVIFRIANRDVFEFRIAAKTRAAARRKALQFARRYTGFANHEVIWCIPAKENGHV